MTTRAQGNQVRRVRRFSAAIVLAVPLLGQSARGGDATWNGATDATWANGANWVPASAPGTGNTATFNNAGNGNTTIDLGGGVAVNTIVFDTAGAAAYTIGGTTANAQTLTLDNGGGVAVNSTVTAATEKFNAKIVLGDASAGTYTLAKTAANAPTLTFAGAITGGAGGTPGGKTLALSTSNAATNGTGYVISGAITDGGAASLALTKSGTGNIQLSGASLYTGGTTISAGSLNINNGSALGSGPVTVLSGANIQFATTGTVNNDLTVAGTGSATVGGAIRYTTSLNLAGNLSLNGDSTVTTGNSNLTFTAGNVNLGASTLTVGSGVATAAGGTTLGSAAKTITGTGGLALNASLLTTGSTFLRLSGANTYTGDTVLKVNAGAGGAAMASLILNNVNALQNSTLDTDVSSAFKQVTFTVAGTNTYNLGGLKGASALAIGANSISVGADNATTNYSGAISGTGGLTKVGTGALTLSAASNTYSGPTGVAAGTLWVNSTHGSAGSGVDNYTVTGSIAGPATLGGNGTLYLGPAKTLTASGTTNTGILAPGGAAGATDTLTVSAGDGTAGVVIGNGGRLLVNFTGGTTSSSLLRITDPSNTTAGGTLDLTSPADSLNPVGTGSGTFTVATFGAYAPGTNVFGSVLLNGAPSQGVNPAAANYALVHYNADNITVDIANATATPEPAASGVLVAAAAGLLARRRRCRGRE